MIFPDLNKLPIRAKLTIWYSLSFLIVVALAFMSFYFVVKGLMVEKIDETLNAQTQEIQKIIKDKYLSTELKEMILTTFKSESTSLVLVINKDFQIIAQSQSFPLQNELFQAILNTINQNQTSQFITINGIRFQITPIYLQDQFIGSIVVGDSITAINQTFSVLLSTLVLIFLILLLPLILISLLEADISLAPLRDLTQEMNNISANKLDSRVAILNPKDEIGEVATAFNDLLDRLEKSFTKEKELIHDLAHQLKTPLTAIRSDIEISLTKKRTYEEYREILKNILQDSGRMNILIKDMLNLAWASNGQQEKQFQKINISNILEEVYEIALQIGQVKKLEIINNIDQEIWIMGQKEKIFQIFLNLIENAIKYTNKKGQITIKAIKEENRAKIFVKDNGIGISKKDLPFIFDRFYRGNSQGEGTGLGLSIAKELTKIHKGKIEVASQKGEGTTFVVSFPLVVEEIKKEKKSLKIPSFHLKKWRMENLRKSS
ncbi:HAMP domain-containing histidine kinase [Candidatus Beckwithbacteria bacterium]|nr:HAMP domain-containing histidine kinase [Candidatus Beckwithbacteria bacterium]